LTKKQLKISQHRLEVAQLLRTFRLSLATRFWIKS